MHDTPDMDLLRKFAEGNSEEAFATLVSRHVNMVYFAALRKTENRHAAEEISQAVFIILAKKAGSLRSGTILSGWLYQTARLTAGNFLRNEIRRANREQEAYMQSLDHDTGAETWQQIAPHLDDALGKLGEKDRNAIVLRFFEGKSFQEVGAAFGASENAAKKRVAYALEKLRNYFSKRGVVSTTAIIAGVVSANSVQAAPAGLALAVAATTAKGSAVSGSTLTLVKGALKIMAWTKAKMAVVVGMSALLAIGTTTIVVRSFVSKSIDQYLTDDSLENYWIAPPMLVIQKTHFPHFDNGVTASLRDDKMAGRNRNLGTMFQFAFSDRFSLFPKSRLILPADLPKTRYDFLVTDTNGVRENFRAEIKRISRYGAHKEVREMDLLIMQLADSGVDKLKISTREDGVRNSHAQIAFLASEIENVFQQPVIDRTGLTNYYDLSVDWHWQGTNRAANLDSYNDALINQLGLKLVPSREPIEMLVVERAKN